MMAGSTLRRVLIILLIGVGTTAYKCEFSSPESKFMIEERLNRFSYQTAWLPSSTSSVQKISLTVTGLKINPECLQTAPLPTVTPPIGTTERPTTSRAVPFVKDSTRIHTGNESYIHKIFKAGSYCVDDMESGEHTTCYYNGSIHLSFDSYEQITPMYFYAEGLVENSSPLCSLHILKYNRSRAKLSGSFKYDEKRSNERPTLYFTFSPADDAFPLPIFLEPKLICGDTDYNLTQMSTENNVYTMERSKFRWSGDSCKIKIYNLREQPVELPVSVPTIVQLTTSTSATTPKDQTAALTSVSILAAVFGALALIFCILFIKLKMPAATVKIISTENSDTKLADNGKPNDYQYEEALPNGPLSHPGETCDLESPTTDSQLFMDQATPLPNDSLPENGDFHYNPSSHKYSGPKSLNENAV